MDFKNVLAAISLSAAVIVLYGLFFAPSQEEIKKIELKEQKNKINKKSEAPKLVENEEIKKITRTDALNEDQRIIFENENIFGSISLNGALIDDLTFKKYTTSVDGEDDEGGDVVVANPTSNEQHLLSLKLIQQITLVIHSWHYLYRIYCR